MVGDKEIYCKNCPHHWKLSDGGRDTYICHKCGYNNNEMKLADILSEVKKPGPIEYPKDHKPGMKVTKGGSMCANCEYWIEEGNICNNEYWLKWRKGNAKIPAAADEYCCNWWHAE